MSDLPFDQAELLKALEEEASLAEDDAPPPVKPTQLNIQIIAKRCFDPKELASLSSDDLAEKMLSIQRLRLDRLNLGSMDGLEVCNAATHLHLQHNLIKQIECLDFFNKLQYLILSHNQLTRLEGIHHLTTLQYLDASHNQIGAVDWQADVPPSLIALELEGNPCSEDPSYRASALSALPLLMVLDEERATIRELRAAGRTGLPEPEEGEEEEGEEEEGEEEEGEEEGEEEVGQKDDKLDEISGDQIDEGVEQMASGSHDRSAVASSAADEVQELATDVAALYSKAMSAHGVEEGSDAFKAKLQAARGRMAERLAAQRASDVDGRDPSASQMPN